MSLMTYNVLIMYLSKFQIGFLNTTFSHFTFSLCGNPWSMEAKIRPAKVTITNLTFNIYKTKSVIFQYANFSLTQ